MGRSLRLFAGGFGGSVVAVAASAFFATSASAVPVGASHCSTGNTPPYVCGDVQVGGFFNGTGANVTEDPTPQNSPGAGASVSLQGGAGGTGITASTTVSGSYGAGHILSTASDSNPENHIDESMIHATGFLTFVDGFTVTSNLQVQFTSSLSGTLMNGEAVSRLDLLDVTASSFTIFDFENSISDSFPTQTLTQDANLVAGHSYIFDWTMDASAEANIGLAVFDEHSSLADLSDTGHLFIDVLTPGGSLQFLSGHDYSTNAASTTPLPGALPLFTTGLGALGLLGLRKKRKALALTAR